MPEDTSTEREQENAARIARAKQLSEKSQTAMVGKYGNATNAIAYALQGLLEIAIVRADVRSYEPPF